MTTELALWLLGSLWVLTVMLAGIVWRLVMGRIKDIDALATSNKDRIHTLETNYNAKFAEVNLNIANVEKSILEAIHQIQLNCALFSHVPKE